MKQFLLVSLLLASSCSGPTVKAPEADGGKQVTQSNEQSSPAAPPPSQLKPQPTTPAPQPSAQKNEPVAPAGKPDDLKRLKKISEAVFAGQYTQIEPEARTYLKERPQSALGHRTLGWLLLKKGDLDESKQSFEQAIQFDPKDDNAYVGLGALARKRQDSDGAVKYYQDAIAIQPKNPEAYGSLVVVHILKKDYKAGIADGEKAMKFDFDDPTLYANLSLAYHFDGDTVNRDKYFKLAKKNNYYNLEKLQTLFEKKQL
ncbi:MAG: tetratricopeptide repeat protein [Thermosynechococcaceae cyanobacterium]